MVILFLNMVERVTFAESIDNQENLLEREGEYLFSCGIDADIVLLSKIYYSCDATFRKMQNSLEVSKQALFFFVFWTFYRNIILIMIVKSNKQLRPILKGKNAPIFSFVS